MVDNVGKVYRLPIHRTKMSIFITSVLDIWSICIT